MLSRHPAAMLVVGCRHRLISPLIRPETFGWIITGTTSMPFAAGVAEPLSTRGAGQGLVVFYGMAKPVLTPPIGPARQP